MPGSLPYGLVQVGFKYRARFVPEQEFALRARYFALNRLSLRLFLSVMYVCSSMNE